MGMFTIRELTSLLISRVNALSSSIDGLWDQGKTQKIGIRRFGDGRVVETMPSLTEIRL
jgi:hypothetical protein